MCIVSESNVMLRMQAETPTGFKVATEEFGDGWTRMRCGGVERLGKKIHTGGWNFLKFAETGANSGVGATSHEAIGCALKLALRRLDRHANAVEVERIQVTKYPWFFVARVRVHPYRIQQGDVRPEPSPAVLLPGSSRSRRALLPAEEIYPSFAAAIPMLKELLTTPGSAPMSA